MREPATEDGRATQGSGGSAWIHATLARRRLNELGDSHLRGVRGEVRQGANQHFYMRKRSRDGERRDFNHRDTARRKAPNSGSQNRGKWARLGKNLSKNLGFETTEHTEHTEKGRVPPRRLAGERCSTSESGVDASALPPHSMELAVAGQPDRWHRPRYRIPAFSNFSLEPLAFALYRADMRNAVNREPSETDCPGRGLGKTGGEALSLVKPRGLAGFRGTWLLVGNMPISRTPLRFRTLGITNI